MTKGNIWLLLTLSSAIITLLIIFFSGFPYLGIALSLAAISSAVYILKNKKPHFTKHSIFSA